MFKKLEKAFGIILQFVNILMMIASVFVITITVMGYDMICLEGTSMEPDIKSGYLALTSPDKSDLKVGDIINFSLKRDGEDYQVFHRIVDVQEEGYVTKGDNNKNNDEGVRTLDDISGYGVLVLPFMGFMAAFVPEALWKILLMQAFLNILVILWITISAKQEEELEEDLTEQMLVQELDNINVGALVDGGGAVN